MRSVRAIAGAVALCYGTAFAQDIDLPDAVVDYMMNPPYEVFSASAFDSSDARRFESDPTGCPGSGPG